MSLIIPTPQIPDEAIAFSKEVAELAEKYDLETVQMEIRIHAGFGSKYWDDTELRLRTQQKMRVFVSRFDDRGRPRKQIVFSVTSDVSVPIVFEPDSSN